MRTYSNASVTVRKGQWQAIVTWQSEDGRRHNLTHMTGIKGDGSGRGRHKAQAEALRWRDSLIAEEASREAVERYKAVEAMRSGRPYDSRALRMGVCDYVVSFVDNTRVSRTTGLPIEGSSKAGYKSIVRNQLLPFLPDGVTVSGLNRDTVEALLADLQEHGYSRSTVRKAFNLLKAAMQAAVEHDGLRANPCAGVRAPSPSRPRLNSLAVSDADALAERLASMSPTVGVTAGRLALACGLREGELAALKLGDCGLEDGFLFVRKAIARTNGEGSSYRKDPKTDAGVRRIPLNHEMRDALVRRRGRLAERCEADHRPLTGGLYLLGHTDGTWTNPSNIGKEWSAISRSLGLVGLAGKPVGLHDLRHTFATYALARGAGVKEVQAVMGHSSASVTLDVYASSDPAERVAMMEGISRMA